MTYPKHFFLLCPVEIAMFLFFCFYWSQYGEETQYEPFFQTNGSMMASCLFLTMVARFLVARFSSVRNGLIASLLIGIISVCFFLKYPIIRDSLALTVLFIGFIVCFLTDRGKKGDRLVRIVFVVLLAIGVVIVFHLIYNFTTLDAGSAMGPDFLLETIDCVVFAASYIIGYQMVKECSGRG